MSDALDELRARRSGVKWTRYEPDVIPAWVADMDLPVMDEISEGLGDFVRLGDFGYTNPDDCERVVEAGRRWYGRHGWIPEPAAMVVMGDVMQGVAGAIAAYTEPGDGVIIQTPVYHPFWGAITSAGRRIVEAPLADRESGYRVDRAGLEAAARQGARMLLMANPHNPTGRVFSAEELSSIAEVAEEFDLVIVSDEIHADLVFQPHRHIPIAAWSAIAARRTVTLLSPSKAFNLAGVGCALGVFGTSELKERFEVRSSFLLGHPRRSAVVASSIAWEQGDRWLSGTMDTFGTNRRRIIDWLAGERRLGWLPAEGTYLAWLDARPLEWSEEPADIVLREARVALSPGAQFGGPGHLRLNFGTYPVILDEILERLGAILNP
ncbi:MAG: aminotransferase class I/II-fold pyridoxal phosphate-dependent enzyme [Acidimicrobiia bacterium]|nr:aminotransferase class I/II-fold pyridoxal phosphate-dependent enzyme [Acidimicrobiia bacterium]